MGIERMALAIGAGSDQIPVITGYKRGSIVISEFDPTDDLESYEPEIRMLPGWKTDISGCKTWRDLPEQAKAYVWELESLIDHEIQLISVGAQREQYLLKGRWL